jgi:hypothetical protein
LEISISSGVIEPAFGLRQLREPDIEMPERRRKGDLLVLGQRLAAKHQHAVLVHRPVDRRDNLRRRRPATIDPADLTDKQRVDLADLHRTTPPPAVPAP